MFLCFSFWILISTMRLQALGGLEPASQQLRYIPSAHCSTSDSFRLKTHSVHTSEVILAHTMSTHSDAPSVRKISVGGKRVSTIVPASRVGGARRRSLGRAAGCTAPCRGACPGCHSCSRWASGRWASDKPPGESSVLHRRSECTEVSKQKTFNNAYILAEYTST